MRLLSAVGAIALLLSLGCSDPGPYTLVGTWETNLHRADGTRTQVVTTFREDGRFTRAILKGPLANLQQVDERRTEEGSWSAADGVVAMKLADGASWKDQIRTLEAKTLYLKCIEGEDPVRGGEYAGSHRR